MSALVLSIHPNADQMALFDTITQKGVDFLMNYGAVMHQIESNTIRDRSLLSLQSDCAEMARLVAQLRQTIKPTQTKTANYLAPSAGDAEDRPKTMTSSVVFAFPVKNDQAANQGGDNDD